MSKILRPSMPFQTGIPGGVYDGKKIKIKGRMPYAAGRVGINLLTGYDPNSDRPLHLGIRFDQHCVVRNHLEYGQWGPEERQGTFPFSFGMEFTMVIVVKGSEYKISVDNRHCWNFRHRLPFERVKSFSMDGTVDVLEIEFIDKRYPVTPQRPRMPAVYNPAPPERPRLPTVYNPTIPYTYPIYGGLRPGMTLYISGRPSSNPRRFSVNFQKGTAQYPAPDIAFHFDPRFFNRSVVRNTQSNGQWGPEETYISHFPFHPGATFELIIRVEVDKYSVSINGQHFTDFRHRLRPLEMFDTLYIENDVSISSIAFS